MTLRQLRYLCEVVRCKLNISVAARTLGASQPAVSQQLQLLEEDLGTPIFLRGRNRLIGLTPKGEAVVIAAQEILAGALSLRSAAAAPPSADVPAIRLVSTYAQARYALPRCIRLFKRHYPLATVRMLPRGDEMLWQFVHDGRADLAIATDTGDVPKTLIRLPCRPIARSLIAPRGHPLLKEKRLTLEAIAKYPLVTTDEQLPGPRRLMRALRSTGLAPRIDVTAVNEDVVKSCVEAGMGVAILASIVFDAKKDTRLGAVDVTPLLEPSMTTVIVRRNTLQFEPVTRFVQCFAPFWTRDMLLHSAHEPR